MAGGLRSHRAGRSARHRQESGGRDAGGRRFEVIDLGVNVSPDKFIGAIREKQANLVAMSALLTTTMPAMKLTIDALQQAGVRDRVKVLIGGAPVTQRYADEIGADGYSETPPGRSPWRGRPWPSPDASQLTSQLSHRLFYAQFCRPGSKGIRANGQTVQNRI